MASTLVRQVPTDDDGTGTVGTVLDAAYWAAHYNNTERRPAGTANPNRAPNRQPPDV
jgi:hypothetical protein